MSNLGYLYYTKGKFSSSEQHFESAAYWLRKSLLKEYELKDSHYYLGLMHQNGEGVDQWYRSAFRYYKVAADFGHDVAWEKLGDLCYSGYGCIRADKTKAFEWYSIGAEKGNSQCFNNMGLMLENGFDGYIPDILQAEEMYCKAYKLKNVDAAFNLGLLYTNYSQFSVEPQNAIKLVYESAVKGNKSAQSYLISLGYANNETEFIENVSPEFVDDYEEQEEDEENVHDNVMTLRYFIMSVC